MSRSYSLFLQIRLIISSTFLCEQFAFVRETKKIFEMSGWTDTNIESSENTSVKPEINKLITNKICHFVENILPINETSEQNPNGYCNVDFCIYAWIQQMLPLFVASW